MSARLMDERAGMLFHSPLLAANGDSAILLQTRTPLNPPDVTQ